MARIKGVSKYGQKEIDYIIANAGTKSTSEIAIGAGIPESVLPKLVTQWRQTGHKIPTLRTTVYPIGETREHRGYMQIKTEGGWKSLSRHNYEKENGKIPRGYEVHHKDGVKANCEPANLYLLPAGTRYGPRENSGTRRRPAKTTTGTTSHKKKPGTDANWTQEYLQAPRKITIPPAPTGKGVRIDSRTVVYPKNPNADVSDLQKRFCRNIDTIKSSSKTA